jgi:GH3 auxin-responsive promoter
MSPMLQSLAGLPAVRRLAHIGLGVYSRRRVAALDRLSLQQTQTEVLRRLVRHARGTRFGLDHRFHSINSVAQYQEKVPLRDYEAFWTHYWKDPFPFLQGVTWPDELPYFALSSGTTSGSTKYVPLSRQMLASNSKAALTMLALFHVVHPCDRLADGRIFFLGGSTDLQNLAARADGPFRPRPRVHGGDLSAIATLEAPPAMRPYSFPPPELALMKDWEKKMTTLAHQSAHLPITAVSGVPSWMLVLFEHLCRVTGKSTVAEIWPTLRLIIHGGTKFDPYHTLFQERIGSDRVHFLEVYPASEGFIATEDLRWSLLRLLPDHGIFYEFMPVDELGRERPRCVPIWQVEPGVNYALVMTTCAGLWRYQIGDTVIFEKRDPPLLRFSGRTRYFLSAFGEHLISEEVERAVAHAAARTGTHAVDFHVGPVFPATPTTPGRHRYLVEFAGPVPDLSCFASTLDEALCRANEDYAAHRQGDLTMLPPEVWPVRHGGFADWMRSRGKLGGQNKVPRMDNSGVITAELSAYFEGQG